MRKKPACSAHHLHPCSLLWEEGAPSPCGKSLTQHPTARPMLEARQAPSPRARAPTGLTHPPLPLSRPGDHIKAAAPAGRDGANAGWALGLKLAAFKLRRIVGSPSAVTQMVLATRSAQQRCARPWHLPGSTQSPHSTLLQIGHWLQYPMLLPLRQGQGCSSPCLRGARQWGGSTSEHSPGGGGGGGTQTPRVLPGAPMAPPSSQPGRAPALGTY